MKRLAIRKAKLSDTPALAELLDQLMGKPITTSEARTRLCRVQKSGKDAVFVACRNGKVVGLISVLITHSFHGEHPQARVMELVVREDHRRQGIGRAMMRHAMAYARRCGCTWFEVTSRMHRKDAHRFYRSMGLKGTSIRFSKELGKR